MGLEFKTAKRRAADKPKPITFTLDGEEYTFTPPKSSTVALMALGDNPSDQLRALFDWIGNKMPEDQQERLLARFRDEDDDLEISFFTEKVFPQLVEEAYGRPTT